LFVPAFVRYDLREGENGWQVARLRAYWELAASLQLSGALLRNQGLPGIARYVSGLTGPARRGKRLIEGALADGRLTDVLPECKWSKVIAAGSTVAASITTPSGRGVLFADLDPRGREITEVSIFRNEK
jgi:hypothetical protein